MNPQATDLLLLATLILLVVISLYAFWLRLSLWFTQQALSRIAVIQAQNGDAGQSNGGCAGLFFGLLLLVAVIGFLLFVRATS